MKIIRTYFVGSSSSSSMSPSSLAQGTGEDEDFPSLDFTSLAKSAPEPTAPSPSANKQELALEPLDLPVLPEATESFELSAPSANQQSTDKAAPNSLSPPLSFISPEAFTSDSLALPVTFPVLKLEPVVEQVARAYAVGRTAEALNTLEKQLAHDTAPERLWWMAFDLYRATGAQESFDRRALEYAEKFEKSPPAWNELSAKSNLQSTESSATAGARASVTINGNLSARSAAQLEKLREVARTRSSLRIDVAKIKNVDQGGCQLLLDLVRSLKNSTCELDLSGAEDLASLIQNKLVVGQRADEAMWLLLLELYQGLGLLDSFEETAVNYAVTFEVSPPSWVVPKRKGTSALSGQMLLVEAKRGTEAEAALSLSGELLGADSGSDDLSAISNRLVQAHPDEPLIIDLMRLRRIDEKSVMALRQTLSGIDDPRRVHLVNCSHLIAAMLEMAGITKQVAVETNRI